MKLPKREKKNWIKAINETWTQQHACSSEKKSHFENMRFAYRPVPQQQQKQQWAIRKWAKATMQMVWFAKFKGRSVNEFSKRRICEKETKKTTIKRNAPKSQILNHGLFQLYSSIVCSLWSLNILKTAVNFMIWSSFDLFAQFSHLMLSVCILLNFWVPAKKKLLDLEVDTWNRRY